MTDIHDEQGALFGMDAVVVPIPKSLSPDRRRTLRQAEAIARGLHPLALVFPWVRMLPTADRSAQASDGKSLPERCGSCRLRQVFSYHNRSYAKCLAPDSASAAEYERQPPRMSHSSASDVRAWWPACTSYEPGDPALSPDAARSIPSG